VVFRSLVERISPGGVVYDGTHILHAYIIRPRSGQIKLFYDIFAILIVKITVLHILKIPPVFKKYFGPPAVSAFGAVLSYDVFPRLAGEIFGKTGASP
jgi:hypothetical protein